MENDPSKQEIETYFKSLQDQICLALENADGKATFKEDAWERPGGGGGRSRVITNGAVIEKGGVNYSAVHGATPTKILEALQLQEADFFATGVSLVIHPLNPHVPIIHMNVRYFEMSNGVKWFGGGIDLTPHYVVEEDAQYFHTQLKMICDKYQASYHETFKKWADDYFYIKHRNETRGIGGIFFDHLKATPTISFSDRFDFIKEVGNSFSTIYTHLMAKNNAIPFDESHKKWQLLRRGRYVEFNLVYDKGTKFGLDTDGRTESILMSMPPVCNWDYNVQTLPGSEEFKTLQLLKKDIHWI
jgi:coproporphyrinogen III oxidase